MALFTTLSIAKITDLTNRLPTNLTDPKLLPYVALLLLLYNLLSSFITTLTDCFTTDITTIPEPYTPPHKRYTIGHNILAHIITAPFEGAKMVNAWRQRHGEIFQLRALLGERVVVVTSERGLREVTITKHASFSKTKATRATLASLIGEQGIILAEGDRHSRLRRAVSPALHHDALISLGDVFLEHGRHLADALGEHGKADDVLREVRLRTFAVIFETCFGKNAAPDEMVDDIREAYLAVFLEPTMRFLIRILLTKFCWFVDPKRFQYRSDLKQYLNKTIYDLCKQSSGRGDRKTLINLMVDATTQKTLACQEMVETVLSFLVAGQVTTSLSVCWTLYLLARHPDWQDRIVEELGNWCEDDGLTGLDELPLLNRTVRESLRLYPPVFSVGRTTNQPVVVDGYRLPKGAAVRVPILALQRSQDIWGGDADEFNPDRFLKEGEMARTKMFWCGFLFGPRGCIGQRFALLEIKAFVAQILIRQRVYVKPMQDPPPEIAGPFCTPKNMILYFEKRNAQ